jgi:amidophosphoribosyltransferase
VCGILGIINVDNAAYCVYKGLLTLQHRGQDAAGILSYNLAQEKFYLHKDRGLAASVFDRETLEALSGSVAIGHTRYSTVGKGEKEDLQPLLLNYPFGIGMVHNGNLVNYFEKRRSLHEQGLRHPLTSNDVEILVNLLALALIKEISERPVSTSSFVQILGRAVREIFAEAHGAYSVLGIVAGKGLFAFRDPKGKKIEASGKTAYCLASETATLNFLKFEFLRDLNPGELVFISMAGELHCLQLSKERHPSPCMFEWVYFASPESVISERSVYAARLNLGRRLAVQIKELQCREEFPIDIVAPVPDSGRVAATSLAETLGVPLRELLIKNRYIQRSFIVNGQENRESTVALKLSPVISEIKDKNVLLVDDSIVRGTTSRRIVELVRKAGAKRVYFAITCPPIRHPCMLGLDFPSCEELVAYQRNEAAVARAIGADKVVYVTREDLRESIGLSEICMACIDGNYPVDISASREFQAKR